jgi:hypothetical protein
MLNDGARPDERFFLQNGTPLVETHIDCWLFRYTKWKVVNGRFISLWFCNHLQFYFGDSKCDGSRTYWAWQNHLAQPDQYVTTKELLAFRFRKTGPSTVRWDNMGGS